MCRSVTIDDVTVVIDTGKMKEIQVDSSSGITRLADTWVSRAAGKQRRGRAGRVRWEVQYSTSAVQGVHGYMETVKSARKYFACTGQECVFGYFHGCSGSS